MKHGSCSAVVLLLLWFLVILLAVECSNANGHKGCVGTKGKNYLREKDESHHTDASESNSNTGPTVYANYGRKILEGRKNLLSMDEKPMHISPGKNKEGDAKVKQDRLSAAYLEAADEVANLMRKDYSAAGRGRRKPPINNQEPKD